MMYTVNVTTQYRKNSSNRMFCGVFCSNRGIFVRQEIILRKRNIKQINQAVISKNTIYWNITADVSEEYISLSSEWNKTCKVAQS
jgi:hypothetical protein